MQRAYDVHVVRGRPRGFTIQMMIECEAWRLGLQSLRKSRRSVVIGEAPSEVAFRHSRLASVSRETVRLARDKDQTKTLLQAAGVPVAEGRAFAAHEQTKAARFARALGYPVVVKPISGGLGRGVTAGIEDEQSFISALSDATAGDFDGQPFIVERHVEGRDLRILSTTERALSVIERRPASVVGDGQSSVEELILAKNEGRRLNPYLMARLIPFENLDAVLARHSLTRSSVLNCGFRLFLNSVANLSRGGDSFEITDRTHPSILGLATTAIRAVPGLPYGGVDLIVKDPCLPVSEQGVVVIEVNGTPDLMMHPFPAYGLPRNVVRDLVIEHLGSAVAVPDAARCDPLEVAVDFAGVSDYGTAISVLRDRCSGLELLHLVRRRGTGVHVRVRGPGARVAMLLASAFSTRRPVPVSRASAVPV